MFADKEKRGKRWARHWRDRRSERVIAREGLRLANKKVENYDKKKERMYFIIVIIV